MSKVIWEFVVKPLDWYCFYYSIRNSQRGAKPRFAWKIVICPFDPDAGRRTKFAPVKSLDSSEFSSEFSDLKTLQSNVKVNPVISWNGQNSLHGNFPSNSQDFTTPQNSFEFSGFYYTWNSFLIKPITQTIGKLALFEKFCHSGKEEAKTGWSNMDREPQKIGCKSHSLINLIQSNTTHCAKLGLMKAQESYIDTSTAQSTAPGLFGGFSFRCLKKLKGGGSWIHSTAQRKEHSKTEFEKKNSENEFGESETFYQSKFSRATGVKWTLSLWLLTRLFKTRAGEASVSLVMWWKICWHNILRAHCGKICPFREILVNKKGRGQNGVEYVDRGPQKVGSKPYSLDHYYLQQYNELSVFGAYEGSRKVTIIPLPLSWPPRATVDINILEDPIESIVFIENW